MTHDGRDNLYVSDGSFTGMSLNTGTYIESIRRITSEGNVTTILGKNPCDRAASNPSAGISWCCKKVWVLDAIQKKVFPGANHDVEGNPVYVDPYVDGSQVSVNTPAGIAITKNGGTLFFNDKYNHMIRQVGCQTGYNLTFGICVGSTKRPTFSPSFAPSSAPTFYPSELPTVEPTSPSFDPSESPTFLPTKIPTEVPTEVPSDIPTWKPTVSSIVPKPYAFAKLENGITVTTLKYFTKNKCENSIIDGKLKVLCEFVPAV
jgi:hypothetical protein